MKLHAFRKFLSALLAAGLGVSFLTPVGAAEITAETYPITETAAAETTAPAATVSEATVPENAAPTLTTEYSEPQETIVQTESSETIPVQSEAAVTELAEPEFAFPCPYNLYFGLLHAHTDLSDGTGSVTDAFAYAASVEGLDFFAVTDHSNSFDNADSGAIGADGAQISAEWAAGKAAAAAVTDETFLGIFGYEMTWQEGKGLGHICTFQTPGWESRNQEAYVNQPTALETYYKTLTTVPNSVSQFCHPGNFYGNFENFGHYSPDYDVVIHLLEVGGEGTFTAFDQYTKALDKGWHLGPSISQNNHNGSWGDANDARTVVLAKALTEDSLFEAIRAHRVYATQDKDLHIWYPDMGVTLSEKASFSIQVSLWDPTDDCVGTVEVISAGGAVLSSQTVTAQAETLTLSVPSGHPYYYLRITQPDGDIAVTAPVWVEKSSALTIDSFSASIDVPVQGQAVSLTLSLSNAGTAAFALDALEFYIGDQQIHRAEAPGTVSDTFPYRFSYTHPDAGVSTIRAVIRGEGQTYETALTLRFRSERIVTGLLVDGSHGNPGIDALEGLRSLAAGNNMDLTVFTGDLPLGGDLLLIHSPQTELDEAFLADVQAFVHNGGSLILCGPDTGGQLNRLLEALNSTLRFHSDTIPAGVTEVFNDTSPWCANLTEGQFYAHTGSCAIDPGSGSWLVKEGQQVILAWEETAYGGGIFAAGSCFLLDEVMPVSESRWELPRANQTIAAAILGKNEAVLTQSAIGDVRNGVSGKVYRIKGYVTAGTSNPYNTFPETIYLQDSTGGIAVTVFDTSGVQVGTPVEIIGCLKEENGNPVMECIDCRFPQERSYNITPKTTRSKTAMDYTARGGQLLQIQGTVVSLVKTANGKGISRLVLKDLLGDTAIVEIEEYIGSGTDGRNTLASDIKTGRTVRAIGLLHLNESGETVLRVRNCDEVVYIPPNTDPTNPKTGDFFGWLWP